MKSLTKFILKNNLTVNIIFNGEKLITFPPRSETRVLYLFSVPVQYSTENTSHCNKTRKIKAM